MTRLLILAAALLLPVLAAAQTPAPTAQPPPCNPKGFVNIVGCKITYAPGCPAPGVPNAVPACFPCPNTNPMQMPIVTVLDQTGVGLQVQYTCPTSINQTLLPAGVLSHYKVTNCP